jgi:2-dehydro-3-deoxygluconokinase
MAQDIDILTIGEPLMEFSEQDRGGVRVYLPGHGGDTSNCAVAAARQGAKAACFTAVGDDAFGRSFLALWDAEGVDRSRALVLPGARTGIYFISYGPGGHVFSYYRAGSAASLVTAPDVPADTVASARVLHVSGISQAISPSACDAVFHAIRLAKEAGALVSYDTNLRLALWPLDRARAVIHAALALADIVRPGLDDARQLTGRETPDAICDHYLGFGVKIVAMTLGAEGTLVATPDRRERVPGRRVEAVDATGAGDTFGGAFLAEHLRTGDPFRAAAYGNAAAALSTQGYGAVAPMPRRPQVEAFLAGAG